MAYAYGDRPQNRVAARSVDRDLADWVLVLTAVVGNVQIAGTVECQGVRMMH